MGNWAEAKKVLKQTNDLERELNLFSADKVSAESIERVTPIVTSPDFNINSIRNNCCAAAALGQWVIDIIYAAAQLQPVQNGNAQPNITRTRPQTAAIPRRASPGPKKKRVVKPQPSVGGYYAPQVFTKSMSPVKSRYGQQKTGKHITYKHVLRNEALQAKTDKIQNEFNQEMAKRGRSPLVKSKALGTIGNMQGIIDLDLDDFYQVMGEFYQDSEVKKHDSPTRRLVQMKNSCWAHKGQLAKKLGRAPNSRYSITYCTSPDKAYKIEPHQGELNYSLAARNPLAFYNSVVSQEVTQHKVRHNAANDRHSFMGDRMEFNSKITVRKIGRIIENVQEGLLALIVNDTGFNREEVRSALDSPEIKA